MGMGVEVLTNGFSVYFCKCVSDTRLRDCETNSPAALRHPLLEGEREAAKMIQKKESL